MGSISRIPRTLAFAPWAAHNKNYFSYQTWFAPLSKIFKRIITFDPQEETYIYGEEHMRERFIAFIAREKPDYLFLWLMYPTSILPETLIRIKEVSPKTKLINFFGDDDVLYPLFTRYMSLFVDFPLASHLDHLQGYKSDGMREPIPSFGVNTSIFKKMPVKKCYDITFIGTPTGDRPMFLKHLIENGIQIRIFGSGWDALPVFAPFYGGKLSAEDMVKVINQSKISINLTKNLEKKPGFKARVFEIGACNSLILTEYFQGYHRFLQEGKEIISFTTPVELLEKVRYFLSHKKECTNIAKRAYQTITSRYSQEAEFRRIFTTLEKKKAFSNYLLPPIGRIVRLTQKDLSLPWEKLIQKIADAEYISFTSSDATPALYKDELQAYGLAKTGLSISCCDCRYNAKGIGIYLSYIASLAYTRASRKRFISLLSREQIVVNKRFFIENHTAFTDFDAHKQKLFAEQKFSLMGLPLLTLSKRPQPKKEELGSYFGTDFENDLRALSNLGLFAQISYLTFITYHSFLGKKLFILRHLAQKTFAKVRFNFHKSKRP